MKRLIIVAALLAAAGMAFAQVASEPATEGEAIGLLLRQATMLKLEARDRDAATDAFRAMTRAGIRVQNAYRLVSGALDDGLRAMEMARLGSAASEVSITADQDQDQLRDQLRDQLKDGSCDLEPDQDQDRTRDRTGADQESGGSSGKSE